MKTLKLVTTGIMILTLGKINLSYAMEEQQKISIEEQINRLQNSMNDNRERIARLEQIIEERFPETNPGYYEAPVVIERAMNEFSKYLQTLTFTSIEHSNFGPVKKIWTDEIGEKVTHFKQVALETEQKLAQGTITSDEANNIIAQWVKAIDQALNAEIIKAKPNLTAEQLNNLRVTTDIVDLKFEVYTEFSKAKLRIASMWRANVDFKCVVASQLP